MSRTLALRALVAAGAAAGPLGAQAVWSPAVRVGPQFVSYDVKEPAQKTISQFAIPIGVAIPITSRFTVDFGGAYATSKVTQPDAEASEISGLTDTQIRANYTLGSDNVVITAGVNVPTGHSTVAFGTEDVAATQVGNDFLAFPVSNMGVGLGGTGGVALARNFGTWNFGGGLSFRYAGEFDAFEVDTTVVRFQPGSEVRVRLGADRPVGAGRIVLGATYATFGDDVAGDFTYSTGDRLIGQAGWQSQLGAASVALSVWDLYRMKGEDASGTAASENIANAALALGFVAGGLTIEPNLEARMATSADEKRQGTLAQVGLRLRGTLGRLEVSPSAAYSVGSVGGGATKADPTGYRAILSVRLNR